MYPIETARGGAKHRAFRLTKALHGVAQRFAEFVRAAHASALDIDDRQAGRAMTARATTPHDAGWPMR